MTLDCVHMIMDISIHVPRMRDDRRHSYVKTNSCDFNPRPSHEGRLPTEPDNRSIAFISIHVPRMRDDSVVSTLLVICWDFNPRPSHEGRLRNSLCNLVYDVYFNPRPSHEGRLNINFCAPGDNSISIHVPRMRDDGVSFCRLRHMPDFNPRPSHEGRPTCAGAAKA